MFSQAAMRVAVSCFVVVLLCVASPGGQTAFAVQAQDDAGWEVIETCTEGLTYPVLPRSQWTFEGVIFSENQDGVRAIRTDVDTSYFIALDSAETFSSAGAFSPDGKWFAYPVGETYYHANMSGDDFLWINAIESVSTDPARTTHRFAWRDSAWRSPTGITFLPVFWLDNERLYFTGGRDSLTDGFQRGILNTGSDQVETWSPAEYSEALLNISPDATRGSIYDRDTQTRLLMDLNTGTTKTPLPDEIGREFVWRYDSASFFAVLRVEDVATEFQLIAFSRDGEPLDMLYTSDTDSARNLSVSPLDNHLAFLAGNRLFIADLVNQQIRDLCFTFDDQYWYNRIVWSPDGSQLAFTYDGYPVLLSLDTLKMEILDYPTGRLVGWYATE